MATSKLPDRREDPMVVGSAAAEDIRTIVPEGTARPSAIPAEIFDSAAAAYAAGERLDMQVLARTLGMSRATLYRRAGNRDQLYSAVIWWHSRHALVDALRQTAGLRGVTRAVEVARQLLEVTDRSTPLRLFLEADPEPALRVLTGPHGGIQERYLDCFERLFDLETSRGNLSFNLDLASLSYAVIRIAEGFLYADVIADRKRDIGRAVTLIEGLLRGLDTSDRRG
jgi:AcrR family transcriptional regulator